MQIMQRLLQCSCGIYVLSRPYRAFKYDMHEMSAEDFREVIDVDLNAPFIVSKAVIPLMIKKVAERLLIFVLLIYLCKDTGR